MPTTVTRQVVADAAALAQAAASSFRDHAARAIAARGRFNCALTGGSAAKLVYAALGEGVDWRRVHLYWGDERALPPWHKDSNYRLALDLLIDRVRIPAGNVHRMPAEEGNAAAYEAALPAELDLIHLGMGPDGHVCSLFPGHALLAERRARVAMIEDSPKPPPRRMTLTLAAIHAARALELLVAGAEKAPAVREAWGDPASQLPAALAGRGSAPMLWFLDRAAAGEIT